MFSIHYVGYVIRNKATGTFYTPVTPGYCGEPYSNWLQNAMIFSTKAAVNLVFNELPDGHEILIVHADNLRIHNTLVGES